MATTVNEPLDLWSDYSMPDSTPMRDFYRGKVIFLTGGTGFLGQIYVEKLLRCEVKLLYVMARSKKGKSGIERLTALYSGPLFTRLKQIDPMYMNRVIAIEGNTRELKIGLTDTIRQELIENVNIILHAAADIFGYVCVYFNRIFTKFYDVPIDPEEMIKIAEHCDVNKEDENILEVITDNFIHPWPNTDSFSKALSEELMKQYGKRIPIVVIRPSIIISTHEDPIPAWCNNIYGLNGMLVACGLGFLRIMVFDPRLKGDVICADFVTNSTLAAIWARYNERKSLKQAKCESITDKAEEFKEDPTSEVDEMNTKIYNVTAKEDAVTWGHISDTMRDIFYEYPSMKSIWCHLPNTTRYRIMEFFFVIFYHAIPGFLYDIVLKFTNNPRRLLPLYRKTHMFMVKLRYFMTQEWKFSHKNMYAVYETMCEHDKLYFPSDVRKFNWDAYFYNYNLGLLKYIGGETLEDFEPARRRFRKFLIAHFFVLVIYYSLLAIFYFYFGRLLGINKIISSQWERIYYLLTEN